MREKTSATVENCRSERDRSAARRLKPLLTILQDVKACKEREDKGGNTIIKIRKVYDEGRRTTVEAQVPE